MNKIKLFSQQDKHAYRQNEQITDAVNQLINTAHKATLGLDDEQRFFAIIEATQTILANAFAVNFDQSREIINEYLDDYHNNVADFIADIYSEWRKKTMITKPVKQTVTMERLGREAHIVGMINDTITTILDSEVNYNPDFDMCEVLAEITKTIHVDLLLEKYNRDKQATKSGYEMSFAQHEKRVRELMNFIFDHDENKARL